MNWSLPLSGTVVKGSNVQLKLAGQSFVNVEIFSGGKMVVRATVSADRKTATAVLDTTKFVDGPLTVTAHAWNSSAGTSFTSDADAGSLSLTVANNIALPPAPPSPAPAPGPAPSPTAGADFHPSDYPTLVFNDEFDGSSLDRTQWCTRYIYGGGQSLQVPDSVCSKNGEGNLDFLNDEMQRYKDFNRNGKTMHEVKGGVLTLWATATGYDSYARFESAMIRSKAVFKPSSTASYYMTARVKLPSVVGTWPAFWLNADRAADGHVTWPPEVDIFEGALNGKDDTASMLHQASIIRGAQTSSGQSEITYAATDYEKTWKNYRASRSLRDVWMEVGLQWTTTGVCYFVDGYKTMCENYRWVENNGASAAPAHLLLNLAIGGQWAGRYGVDDPRFPTSFQIDHVRVYRKGS